MVPGPRRWGGTPRLALFMLPSSPNVMSQSAAVGPLERVLATLTAWPRSGTMMPDRSESCQPDGYSWQSGQAIRQAEIVQAEYQDQRAMYLSPRPVSSQSGCARVASMKARRISAGMVTPIS